MIVRAATAADIPTVARIATASYRAAFTAILEPEALALRDENFFENLFANDFASLRLAVTDSGAVAFSKVTATHLDMLFVAPSTWRHGAGRALLTEAEERGSCTLECFRDNADARRFYERHGWRLVRTYERDFIGRKRAFVFYEKP